ncbi:MAG: c-type cytochrome [Cryomorphaceae bacterium]|nr:c-type cytochrome [Cryomorphaceae bacterium]
MKTQLPTKYFLPILVLIPGMASASPVAEFFYGLFNDMYFWLFLLVAFLLLLAYNAVRMAFNTIERAMRPQAATDEETAEAEVEEEESFFSRWYDKLAGLKPMEKEQDILLDHEYDGIRELDNSLPPWWLYGFYITIIFAVFYMFYYHIGSGKSSVEEYKTEMAEAEKAREAYMAKMDNLVDETNVTLVEDAGRLANGEKIYLQNCAQCHAKDGGGGIGPNLTDDYWIHGNSIEDVFKIIKYGVISKGMQSWKDQINPKNMQDVASYVLSLQGTTPVKPKDPEGEKM